MPNNNLPFLGLQDGKNAHNSAPVLPSGREEFRRAAGRRAGIAGPAALVRRLAGVLRRRLAVNLATSQESLQEQEERQFNLLTHYINSGRRQ